MASIIKNQILKHLSKFTKNLTPDRINISTLKGEGELANLELNEQILMELLDLPTWLRLSKAVCNKVQIKIAWTKLKTIPICVFLDEVEVEMETCDEPRKPSNTSQMPSYSSGGKYGFTDRVVDGISMSINSVTVNFKSHAFQASIQISRILVNSCTPNWAKATDLRHSRVKDTIQDALIIFKEVEWQTLRIEANAIASKDKSFTTTPLRLISNQAKIRISIKKSLNDCSMLATKLQFNLDDLLWVLTDSQLKAMLLFMKSLKQIIEKSSEQTKRLAGEKVKKQSSMDKPPPSRQNRKSSPSQTAESAMNKLFAKLDIKETSYHLYTGRLDLHLCDDTTAVDRKKIQFNPTTDKAHNRHIEGGAMQVTLYKLSLDHYPFHPAGSDRKHWAKYDDGMAARQAWVKQLFSSFTEDFSRVKAALAEHMPPTPTTSPAHSQGPGQSRQQPMSGKLLESAFVLRLEDFTLYRVSSSDSSRSVPKKFLHSDKKSLKLPQEMSSVHFEYTDYYFPEGIDYPVPHANMFVQVNPMKVIVDYLTLLWVNSFALNLAQSMDFDFEEDEGPKMHVDIKLETLMPKIVIPSQVDVTGQADRPDGLQILGSKITVTNSRVEERFSRNELANLITWYEGGKLFDKQTFPNEDTDYVAVPSIFEEHASGDKVYAFGDPVKNSLRSQPNGEVGKEKSSHGKTSHLGINSLKLDATKDVWCLAVDQFWLEFIGVPSSKNRPVAFIESFPVTVWIAMPTACSNQSNDSNMITHNATVLADVKCNGEIGDGCKTSELNDTNKQKGPKAGDTHMLVSIHNKVQLQINHFQFLCLMRILDSFTAFTKQLDDDTVHITQKPAEAQSNIVAVIIRDIEVALVCPAIPEGSSLNTGKLLSDEESDLISPVSEINDPPVGSPVCSERDGEAPIELNTKIIHGSDSALGSSLQSNHQGDDITASKSQPDLELPSIISSTSNSSTTSLTRELSTGNSKFFAGDGSESMMSLTEGAGNSMFYSHRGSFTSSTGGSETNLNVSPQGSTVLLVADNSEPASPARSDRSLSSLSTSSRDSVKPRNREKKSISSAFSNFSKGMEKMSGKLKQNLKRGDYLDEDDFDTLSMRSDMSDEDDDNLMMLMNDGEMPAFERKGSFGDSETTEGSDLKDAETSSVNTISSDKARNVVSVVLFKIHNLEAVVQAVNLNTIAKLGIDHLSPEEFGNVELERFQAKFLAGSKDHCDLPILETAPVNLRFSMGPDAELLAPTAGERGFIHVQANDLDLNLNMSSVTSLTDLIEDEKLADAVPMLVELIQTAVHLKEDKPPTNITSPGAIPLDFNVSKAVIRRTQDGAFHLLGDTHTIPATRKDLSFEDRLSDGDVTVATLKRSPSREDTFSGFEETLTRQNSATESSLSQLTSQNEQLTNQLASSKVIQQSIERENELLRKRLSEAESECVEQSSNSLNEEWGIVTEQDVISAKNLDTADKNIEKIISENTELKKMLEKFTQLDQIKRLKELQGENAQLKEQLKDYAKLSDERDKLLVEVTTSHSDADAWKQERESLMQTLRLLQEELIASEKMRFPNS